MLFRFFIIYPLFSLEISLVPNVPTRYLFMELWILEQFVDLASAEQEISKD